MNAKCLCFSASGLKYQILVGKCSLRSLSQICGKLLLYVTEYMHIRFREQYFGTIEM
jgi:hypothetical protein